MVQGIIKTIAAALCAVFATVSTGINLPFMATSDYSAQYSVEEKATFTKNGRRSFDSLSGSAGAYIDISFDEPTRVNTLELNEVGENIMEFEIFAREKGEFRSIYRQDKAGSFRYCAFPAVETDCIRLVVNKVRGGGKFYLRNIDVFNVSHNRPDFRVTAYGIINCFLDPKGLDPKHFEVITDFILFESAVFDKNGDVKFNDKEYNGEIIDGKEALRIAVNNVRAAAGDDVKLYLNLFGPDGEGDINKEDMHTATFENHSEKIALQIKAILEEFNLDGVYFDYEHPTKPASWKAYSDFLITVDRTIGDKKLGMAIGAWGGSVTAEAKQAVDYVEIMGYDGNDKDGYHASFASGGGALVFDFAVSKGYDLKKCTLGMPFYSREVGGGERSMGYNGFYNKIGKYNNLYYDNGVAFYGNSYQMIYDKTAAAYDCGAGGVMVWHYSCDIPGDEELSLFNAVGNAIQDRSR